MAMKTLLTSLALILGISLVGQQIPQYSHYIFNQFQINPAVAGSKECLDMRFGYRTQWVGFDSAPRTAFASINGLIGRQRKKNKPMHGIGIALESDNAEPFRRTSVQLAYAYHFPMTRELTGSFGLFAGFTQYTVDLTTVRAEPFDPVLERANASNMLIPDISPGFFMRNETFFMGVSLRHLAGNYIDNEELDVNGQRIRVQQVRPHLALSGGKAFSMSKKTNFIPSALVKYAPNVPLALDLNAMLDFDQKLAIGAGYRSGDALIGLVKINFLNYFTVGYAYDFTLSPIRVASANSHEVILGITACPFNGSRGSIPCAAYN